MSLLQRWLAREAEVAVVTLPAKKVGPDPGGAARSAPVIGGCAQWHWRLRAGSLWAAEHVPQLAAGDVLFASSMLNVAELTALRPDVVRGRSGSWRRRHVH